jgi:hypothetical protein
MHALTEGASDDVAIDALDAGGDADVREPRAPQHQHHELERGVFSSRLVAAKKETEQLRIELALAKLERDEARAGLKDTAAAVRHPVASDPLRRVASVVTVANAGESGLQEKVGTLPWVVVASLGTGRYRGLALDALKSARENFGGDCRATFHLVTDRPDGVDAHFNPAFAPYREWPVVSFIMHWRFSRFSRSCFKSLAQRAFLSLSRTLTLSTFLLSET